jgi:hypothetical protein
MLVSSRGWRGGVGENHAERSRSPLYLAYLLRLWQIDGEEAGWRASLRSVANGEQRGFPSLEALFEHLREETGEERRQATDGGRRTADDGR